jgi:transcriptional regulator with XRE-family HTH domain
LPDEITAVFAKRLKQARAMRDVSQRALGAMLGIAKQTGSVRINRYEQQVNKADMDTAGELARALDVPLAYLFAESDDLAEVILAFSKLNKAERTKVVADLKSRVQAKGKA